jgi:hypothetical protein
MGNVEAVMVSDMMGQPCIIKAHVGKSKRRLGSPDLRMAPESWGIVVCDLIIGR